MFKFSPGARLIVPFILFIAFNCTAQIKLKESFDYKTTADSNFSKNLTRESIENSSIFVLSDFLKDNANPKRVIKSVSTNSNFMSLSGIPQTSVNDTWLLLTTKIQKAPNDSLFISAGHFGYCFDNPQEIRFDTIEVWASKSGPLVNEMKYLIGKVCLHDSAPTWQHFIFPLAPALNFDSEYTLGVRYISNNYGFEQGKNGSSIWIDNIFIGKNVFSNGISKEPSSKDKNLISLIKPNPAHESIELQLTKPIYNGFTVKLYTINGQLILTEKHIDNNKTSIKIDCTTLVTGNYLLTVESKDGKTDTRQIVIQH